MSNYRFGLEKYSGPGSRYDCPNCGSKKRFTRYIDTNTGEHLDPTVGRCERIGSCCYHFKPWEYFRAKGIPYVLGSASKPISEKPKPISFINSGLLISSMKAYQRNNFVIFLKSLLGSKKVKELVEEYRIGTSKYWPGATIFWQVDMNERVRTGKIMLYDPTTGKRVKEPVNRIHWAHRFSNDPHFRLSQCLFGEHLLKLAPSKPVAIVESEKTAIIASTFYPQYVWLACGGISQLSPEKCLSLKGREVTLIPDADAYHSWLDKARNLEESLLQRVKVSQVVEKVATNSERKKGWDIADYLLQERSLGPINI